MSAAAAKHDHKLYDWEVLRNFSGEHRFFKDNNSGRIGIADQSGRWPHSTNEGVVWLNTTGKLAIKGPTSKAKLQFFAIPALTVEDEPAWTLVGAMEAVWISFTFDIPIKFSLSESDCYLVRCRLVEA